MEIATKLRYEALILAVPEITHDESATIESHLKELIAKNNGDFISFDRWGKYRLAYEIRKNAYGVYYLARFEFNSEKVIAQVLEELRKFLAVKYNELIMRHMFTRLDETASLEYKKPESLEDAPRRENNGFSRNRNRFGAQSHNESTEDNDLLEESIDLGFDDNSEDEDSHETNSRN